MTPALWRVFKSKAKKEARYEAVYEAKGFFVEGQVYGPG